MIRETTCFGFDSETLSNGVASKSEKLEVGKKVRVGVMACSPKGETQATFRNFTYKVLKE
jgi:regulation of enolase protein 1 (concanavalin A-like superfamily)